MPSISAASTVRTSALETRDTKFMVEIRDDGLRAERAATSWATSAAERAPPSCSSPATEAEARLQGGFSIQRLPSPEGVIDFRIVETLNDPKRVEANLARAAEADSLGGEKLTFSELRFAYRQASKDGFSDVEQTALAERFAKFSEEGQLTAAARLHFGHLQKKFGL
jgi:hypothetical protein